jgi:thiol-disulfide isomerase/thioredoxin
MKQKISDFINKQKSKKPLALASDILFLVIFILLLIPSTRKELKTFVTKITMTQPRIINSNEVVLSESELSFTFLDENRNEISLSSLKDSVIFLNFWATWCPPCRAEMPSIQNLYNNYSTKIKFVFISNENPSVINKYLEENNYNLPISYPKSEPTGKINFSTIPTTFIIGKNGELLLSKKGAAKWDGENIRNLINNHINN